jgi:hypothetical protein
MESERQRATTREAGFTPAGVHPRPEEFSGARPSRAERQDPNPAMGGEMAMPSLWILVIGMTAQSPAKGCGLFPAL